MGPIVWTVLIEALTLSVFRRLPERDALDALIAMGTGKQPGIGTE